MLALSCLPTLIRLADVTVRLLVTMETDGFQEENQGESPGIERRFLGHGLDTSEHHSVVLFIHERQDRIVVGGEESKILVIDT